MIDSRSAYTRAPEDGVLFEDCNPVLVGGENHLYNREMASKLMQISSELTSDHIIIQTLPTRDNPFNDPQ